MGEFMITADKYTDLVSKYSSYIASSPLLNLSVDPYTNETKVVLNIEFTSHPTLGITKFRIREWYDSNDELVQYRYCWETNSKPTGNISAWENEHNHGLSTDPHHRHHVLYDRKPVQANHDIRTLEQAFEFVISYLSTGNDYP